MGFDDIKETVGSEYHWVQREPRCEEAEAYELSGGEDVGKGWEAVGFY